MRVSTYEIILPLIGQDDKEIAGKALLVNGLYGAIDVVGADEAQALEKGEVDKLSLPLRERLTQRGHITCKDEAGELADAQLLGRGWRKLIGQSGIAPVILPTYDCNFRCPYCFERHRLSKGQEWLAHEMKPEMVEAVFAALKKQREKGRKIDAISLYGGEPLLAENMATVREICERAREMGLSMSAITNGYDLDKYLPLLTEFSFTQLQITLDGVGELNDRRRLHRDGVPTYERILENVILALEHGIDISLRINTNGENIHGVKALIDDLSAHGLKETSFKERRATRRAEKAAKAAGKPCPKRKGLFSYYFKAVSEPLDSPTLVTERQILDAILVAGKSPLEAIQRQSQYSMHLNGLEKIMEKTSYPYASPAFCGSEGGMVVIGPDGQIYPCWDLVAMDEEAVGFTDRTTGSFFFNFGRAKWRTRTSDLMKSCQTCPYMFICRGGCAPHAKMEHGSYFREYCGEVKEIFAYVASRAVGCQWEKVQEDELSLSLCGPLSRLTEAEREILSNTTSQQEMLTILQDADIFSYNNEDN